jgi:integrase
MSESNPTAGAVNKPRRVSTGERNIYKRSDGKYEIGFKDGAGVQRWRTVEGGVMAARALRDELLARRGRGEKVAPNPRLRFGDAADRWLTGYVADLRETTQAGYRNSVDRHLRPRYETRRLDAITPDDLVVLIRELRAQGLSEATCSAVVAALRQIYRYAARRLSWAGQDPTTLLLRSERPKVSQAARRQIFEGEEIAQTIAAASEPWRTLFLVAALTGARVSELCGLTWAHVKALDSLDDAEIEFAVQVDRKGKQRPTKTDGSVRTIPLPRELAAVLAKHKLRSSHSTDDDYVFATRTGRPLSQRNVSRALRAAQRSAVTPDGLPTFPVLHEKDRHGKPVKVPRGAVPSMHSYRHTYASRYLLAGESVDELAFMLGHRNANVTRSVYLHEMADARRKAARRSRVEAEYGSALEAARSDLPTRKSATVTNLTPVQPQSGSA